MRSPKCPVCRFPQSKCSLTHEMSATPPLPASWRIALSITVRASTAVKHKLFLSVDCIERSAAFASPAESVGADHFGLGVGVASCPTPR